MYYGAYGATGCAHLVCALQVIYDDGSITDLSALANVKSVNGPLVVYGNADAKLTTLAGLEGIKVGQQQLVVSSDCDAQCAVRFGCLNDASVQHYCQVLLNSGWQLEGQGATIHTSAVSVCSMRSIYLSICARTTL